MRLKKTTVLTGNHGVKQPRDRAQSDHDAMQNMFKNELSIQNHLSGNSQRTNEEKKYAAKKNNHLVIEEE